MSTTIEYQNIHENRNYKDTLFYKVLDTSDLSNGDHQLTVFVKNNQTNEIIASTAKKVKIKKN